MTTLVLFRVIIFIIIIIRMHHDFMNCQSLTVFQGPRLSTQDALRMQHQVLANTRDAMIWPRQFRWYRMKRDGLDVSTIPLVLKMCRQVGLNDVCGSTIDGDLPTAGHTAVWVVGQGHAEHLSMTTVVGAKIRPIVWIHIIIILARMIMGKFAKESGEYGFGCSTADIIGGRMEHCYY